MEFRHRIEAISDAFSGMQEELEKEKKYFANKWSRDEKRLDQVRKHTLGMYGDMQGIVGRELPELKDLQLED